MSHLVVFDTNVFVSYLFPSRKVSAVKLAVNKLFSGKVRALLDVILKDGRYIDPAPTLTHFIDPSDKPFYDAALSSGAWLVTDNKKHYPDESFIVSPREYIERAGL